MSTEMNYTWNWFRPSYRFLLKLIRSNCNPILFGIMLPCVGISFNGATYVVCDWILHRKFLHGPYMQILYMQRMLIPHIYLCFRIIPNTTYMRNSVFKKYFIKKKCGSIINRNRNLIPLQATPSSWVLLPIQSQLLLEARSSFFGQRG